MSTQPSGSGTGAGPASGTPRSVGVLGNSKRSGESRAATSSPDREPNDITHSPSALMVTRTKRPHEANKPSKFLARPVDIRSSHHGRCPTVTGRWRQYGRSSREPQAGNGWEQTGQIRYGYGAFL